MPPRSRHSSTNRPPRNSSRIPTAVRGREAPAYAELAQAAQAAGFEVTASQVHDWVVDGLLPRTANQVSVGRHGFVTERAPDVTPQLLVLCQLRRQTKSRHKLAGDPDDDAPALQAARRDLTTAVLDRVELWGPFVTALRPRPAFAALIAAGAYQAAEPAMARIEIRLGDQL